MLNIYFANQFKDLKSFFLKKVLENFLNRILYVKLQQTKNLSPDRIESNHPIAPKSSKHLFNLSANVIHEYNPSLWTNQIDSTNAIQNIRRPDVYGERVFACSSFVCCCCCLFFRPFQSRTRFIY